MKKVLLILISVVLVSTLVLAGCAEPTPAPTPSPAPSPSPSPSPTPTPAETVKIGLLYPLTGPMAMTGARMLEANQLAFEHVGYEVAGKKIEVITGDSGSQPAMAIDTARKMVEHDNVAIILGPIMGNVKIAVADYMSKIGRPHLNTSPASWPILTPAMPWSFAGGGSEQQFSSAAGAYAYEMGARTATVMTEDLFHAHGFIDAFKAAFEAKGGKIIQEQYTPYPANDFSSYLVALKDADILAAWYEGSDAILFLNQVHEYGIRQRMPVYAAFFGSFLANFIIHELPAEAADATIGEITTTPYTPFLEHAENQNFVKVFQEKYGYLPDDTDTTPYDGGTIVVEALKATNGDTTPEALRDAILNLDFMGVQGRIYFDKEMQCRIRDVYVCEVQKQEGKYLWSPIHVFKDVPPAGFAPPPAPPPEGQGH